MTTAQLIETVLQAPPERQAAIIAAAAGGTPKARPGTIRQAAEIGACNPRTIQRYADQGLLHPIRISPRRVRFDLNEVERLFTMGADAVRKAGG
jgi:hypothetical protein